MYYIKNGMSLGLFCSLGYYVSRTGPISFGLRYVDEKNVYLSKKMIQKLFPDQ